MKGLVSLRNSIPPAYRWPLLVALILHIVLISFLFVSLPTPEYRLPGPLSKTNIIDANVVNQAQVGKAVEKIEQERAAAQQREREQAEQMRAQAAELKQQQLREQQHAAQLRLQQEKLLQQQQQEKALAIKLNNQRIAEKKAAEAQKKAEEAQKKAAALAKQNALEAQKKAAAAHALAVKQQQEKVHQAQLAKQKALAAESKKLEQQMLQQQLNNDQSELAAAQARRINGIVNIYIARIRNKVHDTWTKPQNVDNLSTTFAIQLAPGGVVLSVELVRSSGNSIFDRSAKVAIYKASPLPVPQDPLVFDKFRNFDFTFHS